MPISAAGTLGQDTQAPLSHRLFECSPLGQRAVEEAGEAAGGGHRDRQLDRHHCGETAGNQGRGRAVNGRWPTASHPGADTAGKDGQASPPSGGPPRQRLAGRRALPPCRSRSGGSRDRRRTRPWPRKWTAWRARPSAAPGQASAASPPGRRLRNVSSSGGRRGAGVGEQPGVAGAGRSPAPPRRGDHRGIRNGG